MTVTGRIFWQARVFEMLPFQMNCEHGIPRTKNVRQPTPRKHKSINQEKDKSSPLQFRVAQKLF